MLSKTAALLALALVASVTASADFSYTTTTKTTGGAMSAMAGSAADRSARHYLKGQKMMRDSADSAVIIDFGAQTVTTIHHAQKTYTVKPFSEVGAAAGNSDMSIEVKDTGQKKLVNGFHASELAVTMNMDMETGRGSASTMQPMKMQMEMDLWISGEVPGADELQAFFKKYMASFPWSAMMGAGGNESMQKAMVQVQRKTAELNGVQVQQVIHVRPAGGAQVPQMPVMPQMTAAQTAQMQAAMAKMQEMAKQGGPGAAAAQQAMAAMGSMGRGAAAGAGSGSGALIEITVDASEFSNAGVPDSVFAIPDGYKQVQ
jgi:hypothetical protein